jgi:hypothetical protein
MKRVVLRASDVAAIIGRNQYKPRQEVLDELWKKYNPETFKGKTKREKAMAIIHASPIAREVLNCVSQIKAKDSTEVQNIISNVRKHINSDEKMTKEQKDEVIAHITSNVYTSHGVRSEDRTSDKVATDENVRLVKDNSFYNYEICTIDDVKFVVTGKIDRIEERPDGSRVLVEIKNRTNRLFRRVVEYEMVQVQVYLQMLGLIHARLVEQYNNQVLSHDVTRDEELWANVIVPGLELFCKDLYASMYEITE